MYTISLRLYWKVSCSNYSLLILSGLDFVLVISLRLQTQGQEKGEERKKGHTVPWNVMQCELPLRSTCVCSVSSHNCCRNWSMIPLSKKSPFRTETYTYTHTLHDKISKSGSNTNSLILIIFTNISPSLTVTLILKRATRLFRTTL